MSIAEQLKIEGIEKGTECVTINLLKKGVALEFIAEAMGLKVETIQRLQEETSH
jgi:predicted transposase YdaD